MNKIVLAIGTILIVGVIAVVMLVPKPSVPQEVDNSTDQAAGGNTELAVDIISDLEYFPGAKGYFVKPQGDMVHPGIVMIHENRGLRPEIKATAEKLAREGFMVLAVDLFDGKVVETQDEAKVLTADFKQEIGTENMKAAVKYLRDRGATKIASWGWCFGGRQSVALAISGEKLDATVVYYGGGMATTVDELKPITWPVLGVFGGEDKAIPVEKVNEFKSSLTTLGISNEIYVYPGVGHAFANPSNPNHAPAETEDAWQKTVDFLNAKLK